MTPVAIPTLYRGSVKDVLGPVQVSQAAGQSSYAAIVFKYTDAYSVFDWGRMPDALPGKGAALATLAAHWFEKIESPETWKEFSKSPEALRLRKSNRFGSELIEAGEVLQREGLRTHYLGVADQPGASGLDGRRLADSDQPASHLIARQVSVIPPRFHAVLGKQLPDYSETRASSLPRLIPLEVVFRYSFPPGSSILERVERIPHYLESIGYPGASVFEGATLDLPIVELFTKLEPSDRPVSLSEGLSISGLSARQLEQMLHKTIWAAAWLKHELARVGLELADGKFEWGLAEDGSCFLVDAIGPDELRILKDGVQLSKEFLRSHYRSTAWFAAVNQAKVRASAEGQAEWKKLVAEGPPALPPEYREVATQLYPTLTNALSGERWFKNAWELPELLGKMRRLGSESAK